MSEVPQVPDPVRFTARALERLGAAVEQGRGRVTALLPAPVGAALGLPEGVDLTEHGDGGTVACGIGSPVLERLVDLGRGGTPVAAARWEGAPPPESVARSLGEQYDVRNGVARVTGVKSGRTTYLRVGLAWRVEADERHEGIVLATVHPSDGARPDDALLAGWCLEDAPGHAAEVPDGGTVAAWIRRLAPAVVEPVVAPLLALTHRRQARDHQRLADYYGALLSESAAPRRRVDPATLAARLDHITRERDSRLVDLQHRYRARVGWTVASLLFVSCPTWYVTLQVRRRKKERDLLLRIPGQTRRVDRLPCAACGGWLERPVLCDEQLHLLCERCAPQATGRPRCGACGG